jgi:tetratricopeptide (TPR) repeat protein
MADALALAKKELAKNPDNVEWRDLSATLSLRAGKYNDAIDTLERLKAEKGNSVDVRNNLLWAYLMANRLSDESERDAIALASDSNLSDAALHTVAMVALERGRVVEAANFAMKLHLRSSDELTPAQWLLRARLLQRMGYDAEAKAAYAKMPATTEPQLLELRKRWQSTPVAAER